ncbi:uncharacterized protein LOC104860873 [Fukomys damarensis]|uniref:uncharacterized protein LOC104860873 n=1 Tax=Fukomys damarensis TaxID=885580 RepID=UPI00053FE2E7|nr:uncharacterized protein LOC104860873 [Fukomys damarensis]
MGDNRAETKPRALGRAGLVWSRVALPEASAGAAVGCLGRWIPARQTPARYPEFSAGRALHLAVEVQTALAALKLVDAGAPRSQICRPGFLPSHPASVATSSVGRGGSLTGVLPVMSSLVHARLLLLARPSSGRRCSGLVEGLRAVPRQLFPIKGPAGSLSPCSCLPGLQLRCLSQLPQADEALFTYFLLILKLRSPPGNSSCNLDTSSISNVWSAVSPSLFSLSFRSFNVFQTAAVLRSSKALNINVEKIETLITLT